MTAQSAAPKNANDQNTKAVFGPILVQTPPPSTSPDDPTPLSAEERANYVEAPEDAANRRLGILSLKDTSQFDRHRIIFDSIWSDLASRGQVYREIVSNPDKVSPRVYLHGADMPMIDLGGRQMTSLLAEYGFYTINSSQSFPLVANVIITALSGGFLRDTLAGRTLIVPLKPRDRQAFSGGHNFQREAKGNREAMMTEMFGRAKNVLLALESQATYLPREESRLQDLTGFIMRCAIHEGWSETGSEILRAMTETQSAEADMNNPLHRAIELYIGGVCQYGMAHDQPIKMSALAARLHHAAHKACIDLKFEAHVSNMRSKITSQRSTLERKFGLCMKPNRDHSHDYWFDPLPETLTECQDFAVQISPLWNTRANFPVEDL